MTIDMDSLKNVLQNGETPQWAAKAEPFPAVDASNKSSAMVTWCITAVAAVALILGYIFMTNSNPDMHFKIAIPIFIAVVAVFFALRPIFDARSIRQNCTFVVTDQNIMIKESDTDARTMPLSKVDEALFIDKGNGLGDIVFGSAATARPYNKIRSTVLKSVSESGEGGGIAGMAFFNVKDYAIVKTLLPKGTKIIEKTLAQASAK